MQPPQAPSRPIVAQQALNELIDYYRQLANYHHSSVNYYQQLVEQHSKEIKLVEKQMASIEALLNPLAKDSQSENGAVIQKQVDETSQVASPTDSTLDTEMPEAESSAAGEVEENLADLTDCDRDQIETQTTSEIGDFSGNGKTTAKSEPLNVENSPENVPETQASATEQEITNRSTESKQGTTETKKTKVKANSKSTSSGTKATRGSKKRSKTKETRKPFSSRLPYSPLLEPYETISDAVAGCLQEHYPHVMSADDILKYYYPEGLTGETKTRAYGAFSNTLSKGAGKKGWIKESIGKYRWREGI